VITVLGFFSLALINFSNSVRFEHYWSDLVSPPISRFVSQHISESSSLPSGLTIDSINGSQIRSGQDYSDNYLARLNVGQIVVDVGNNFITASALLPSNRLLKFESDFSGNAVYEFYRWIIYHELSVRDDQLQVTDVIQNLEEELNVAILKVSDESSLNSQLILNAVSDHGSFEYLVGSTIHGFIRLKGGELYQVRYPETYSAFPWLVVLFLTALFILVLMLLVFSLVQKFDRRIRNIETAASRISRGELDARVSRAGDEDAISRLGSAFNSMADHIQRLMYVQKEMIHAVSHELRTPVARIRFGVQMIEDCGSEEMLQKQVRGIDGDIQELDELIDEILTYARLEQGGPILAFQEADVAAIVEQVVSEQGSVKPEMTIFSAYKDGSETWKISEVEARYIHRSIQNLVGNATRYANGKVKVMCSFDSETCRVDVEDDGPGIPEDDWESVFTPFARLDDSRTRSSGGYGLGLSIVRRILYWHGGQAFLGRSAMGGAKFSLVWPRKQVKP